MPSSSEPHLGLPQSRSLKPNYGIDAPDLVRRFFVLGGVVLTGGIVAMLYGHRISRIIPYFGPPLLTMGITFLGQSIVMIFGSKVGKLRLRQRLLDGIPWRGDEQVLDVGCGHGLMLIGAAKHLKSGKAVGIDLWQKQDQAGNSREATRLNVEVEGVTDRVALCDGDARKLPFGDASFDLILSSWALHNIYDAPGRETAIQEIVRVLKPGGRLVLVDIRHTAEYARVLRRASMRDVQRSRPNFLFVIPSRSVTATRL
jgi:arsenite methyltransferase